MTGAPGVFTGMGNAAAAELVVMYDHLQAGRLKETVSAWKSLRPLSMLLWTAPFNPVAKAASNLSGRNVGQCRHPVQPLSAGEMAQVEAAYAQLRGK